MSELMKYAESADLYSKISNLITAKKYTVSRAVNSAIVFLYWEIGETICKDILQNHKAEYGKNIMAIPHKERLATLHAICLQISRHILQKCS